MFLRSVKEISLTFINLHKIKGLSEQFVYFNDDLFILKPLKQETFFKQNLPVNVAIMDIIESSELAPILLNNMKVINQNFNKKITKDKSKNSIILKNFFKWFNFSYGSRIKRTLSLMQWPYFTGFLEYHHPQPFLKTTFNEVWKKENKLLKKVSASKFRNSDEINQYLFKYWQFVTGSFYPDTYKNAYKKRKYCGVTGSEDAIKVSKYLDNNKYEMLCINDKILNDSEFDFCKNQINSALERVLETKSSFEK